MIIEELAWKNFKSYGNSVQKLELSTDCGELILLVGKNGSGKTAIGDVLTYVGYGVARGKNGKRTLLSTLPNRLNGDLWTSIKFSSGKSKIEIERSMNPSKVKLVENGVQYKKAGDIQGKINDWIGFDYDTFNSFISMSINDFKNFMSLGVDDKRKLLDRLFNIEVINTLMKIVKAMRADNDKQLAEAGGEVRALSSNITRLQTAIDNTLSKKEQDKATEIETLVEQFKRQKPVYDEYITNIAKLKDKKAQMADVVQKLQGSIQELKGSGQVLKTKIDAYEAGECPTCGSELSDDGHVAVLENLKHTFEQMKATSEKLNSKLSEARNIQSTAETSLNNQERVFAQFKGELERMKRRINELKDDSTEDQDSAVDEMRTALKGMVDQMSDMEGKVSEYSGMDYVYDMAADVFSEKGVKRQILAKIVKPINTLIKQNIDYLGLDYVVTLNESFDASVFENGLEIDTDCLSTGETKKINMCIMLAYIEMIRMKRHVNVMFLDEVFASIDVEGIYSMLQMLRRFVSKYKVNVFLVHHSELMESYFDRVLKIEKHVFSQIDEQLNPEPIMT